MLSRERTPDTVVVTGVGLVAASGAGPEDLHRTLCRGLPLWTTDAGAGPLPSAPIRDFDARAILDRRGLKDLSRTSQLACAAAARAAGSLAGVEPAATGVVLGTGWGSLTPVVDFEWETCTVAPRQVDPLLFAETVSNVPAGQVSIQFGWSAFNLTLSSGAVSGLEAIGMAASLLAEGRAAAVVAGGADSLNLAALRVLREDGALAGDTDSRPFGEGRSGTAAGEGACLLILEREGSAGERGARPLARVRAVDVACAPPEEAGKAGATAAGIERLLRRLFDQAGLAAEEVDLVVASAGGSPVADREEAHALQALFGAVGNAPVICAPKGILGECWGASGPLGVATALESMRTGIVPGASVDFVPDPGLPPLHLPPGSVERRVRHALIVAIATGGQIAGLLLEAPEGR